MLKENKKEILQAKSLRWLANNFPFTPFPKDDDDRLCNAINIYCTAGAELLEKQAEKICELEELLKHVNSGIHK